MAKRLRWARVHLYWLSRAIAVITVACLTACSPHSEGPSRLDDYLSRLERAVGATRESPPPIRPPRLSEARLEPLAISAQSISVLDFLALSGCELQHNLGRRNSSLGRSASDSQRLLLDLEFIDLVPACVIHLNASGNTELGEHLQILALERKKLLPKRIYNALFVGPEFHAFWQLPRQLANYPAEVGGEVIDTLGYLEQQVKRWLGGDYRADDGELEQHLSVLRSGDGGALLLASTVQSKTLFQASAILRHNETVKSLCPKGRSTDAALITQTVVSKFFAGQVQQWLAQLALRESSLMPPLRGIEDLLNDVLPPEYRDWQISRDARLLSLRGEPKAHVDTIQAALSDCTALPWRP